MKRSAARGSGVSPDAKLARGDSNMAASSLNEDTIQDIQEETEKSATTELNLRDIHNLLKSIQGAISVMQGTIATKEDNKLSGDVVELRNVIAKNNCEVEKLKKDFIEQNKYVAFLELGLEREKKLLTNKEATFKNFKKALTSLNNIPVKTLLKFMAFQRIKVFQPRKSSARLQQQSVLRWHRIIPRSLIAYIERKEQNRSLPSFQIRKTRQNESSTQECNSVYPLPELLGNRSS